MSATLPLSPGENCCVTPCEDVQVVNIPGPKGDPGTDGIDGSDGLNSFTLTTAQFTVPAELATVVINVVDSSWAALSQIVYIQNAGWYRVTAKPSTIQLTVQNLEDSATGAYTENVAPATVVASGSKVCPGGLQGPSGGTPAGTALAIANNLSEGNAATMRTNLGLVIGTNVQAFDADLTTWAGITPSANVQSLVGAANYAAIRALLVLVPGTDIQAFNAFLLSIAALGTAADRMIYTTAVDTAAEAILTAAGRAILDDATNIAQRQTLEVLPRDGLLGSLTAVNLNVSGDTLIPIVGSTRYRITRIVIENASISLSTVTVGIFSAAGGIGTIAADQAVSGATGTNKFVSLTISSIGLTDIFTGTDLYFRVGTPQGAAATGNIWLFGESFS